jgi:hypothetical protein
MGEATLSGTRRGNERPLCHQAVSGGPAVSRGQFYVGTADGQVIAYGLP